MRIGILAIALAVQEAPKPVAVGEKVPDFTLTDLAGRKVSLAELRKRSSFGWRFGGG